MKDLVSIESVVPVLAGLTCSNHMLVQLTWQSAYQRKVRNTNSAKAKYDDFFVKKSM
jgi:hypothetical protein